MRRYGLPIAELGFLLLLLDRLYRVLHPEVDLARASLVGATAFAVLAPLWLLRRRPLEPWSGALAIFASAAGSVLLIEAGLFASRSLASGAVHVLILAVAFLALEGAWRARQPAAPAHVGTSTRARR